MLMKRRDVTPERCHQHSFPQMLLADCSLPLPPPKNPVMPPTELAIK